MGHAEITWSATHSPFVEAHGQMKTPNPSPQMIEHISSGNGQAYSKKPSTGSRNQNIEYGCIFEVLRASFTIRSLSRAYS